MSQTATLTQTVNATVNYFPADGETFVLAGTAGYQRRAFDSRKIKVTNIRGNEEDYTLEECGFQIVKEDWTQVDPDEEPKQIEALLFPEAARILRKMYEDVLTERLPDIELTNTQNWRINSSAILPTHPQSYR